MNKKNKEEDLWCEYSDLPSPKAYINCADYDSMGNHGRFPKTIKKETSQNRFQNLFNKLFKNEKHKSTISK
jgi:hypothetical protein